MQKTAHFRVEPKLAHVLGESYTSSEKALKDKPARRGRAGGADQSAPASRFHKLHHQTGK
jgi:hypothetical protein